MSRLMRIVCSLLFVALIGWSGYTIYQYFFDTSIPEIVVHGITPDGHYADVLNCVIEGRDGYKVKNLSLKIDDRIVLNNYSINRRSFSYPLSIPTLALAKGPHVLAIEIIDAARHPNSAAMSIPFHVDNEPLECTLILHDTVPKIFQGRMLHVQFQSNKDIKRAVVKALSYELECFKESPKSTIYECFVPVAIDESVNEYLATVSIEDYVGNRKQLETAFQVISYPFKTKNITVGNKKDAEEYTAKSEQECNAILTELANKSVRKKLWTGTFFAPCAYSTVSADFGVKRISVERGRYTHNGVDFTALPKSAVWACQDGLVVFVGDLGPTGNTVIIDHGYGLLSIYGHLDTFAPVQVGDAIRKGSLVGKIGKTGYATGYHLHWETRLYNIPVDPMEWLK